MHPGRRRAIQRRPLPRPVASAGTGEEREGEPRSTAPAAFDALQRSAGNAAVAALVQRTGETGSGRPLPPGSAAEHALGSLAPAVRLHEGTIPERPEALAVARGLDITVAPGAPRPGTMEGEALLAHEAVHVLQQSRPGPAVAAGEAETRADAAASAALAGQAPPDVGSAAGPHFFEAKWHQATLTNAMAKEGFSDAEQQEAYFSNWCRDVSQFMVPPAKEYIGPQNVMTLLNVMSQMKFGRPVTPQQLGRYSRREHIDAPAGTTNDDQINQQLNLTGRGQVAFEGGPQTEASPKGTEDLSSGKIADLMQLDASGTPAYIHSSRDYIIEQAKAAVEAGRTADGLAHLGNFSHTVQDLFAHSNWVEMAVGRLIELKKITLDPAGPGPEGEAARDVKKRGEAGLPRIETYAGEVRAGAGEARPILMTGTFSGALGDPGHDTLISIRHEVKNFLNDHNPFAPGNTDAAYFDLGVELLRRAEASANEGALGKIFAESVEGVAGSDPIRLRIEKLSSDLEQSGRELGGEGRLGSILAGAGRLVGGAAQTAAGWTGDAWRNGLKSATTTVANGVLSNATVVDMAELALKGRGLIKVAWNGVKEFVQGLPDRIRDIIMPELVKAEEAFKKKVQELGNAAWQVAVGKLMEALGEIPHDAERESPVFKKMEDIRTRQLPKLRAEMIAAIKAVSNGPEADQAIGVIEKAELGTIIPYLQGPAFQGLLQALDEGEQFRLSKTGEQFSQMQERIDQFENMPDWAKPGPSHSQLAKDHATSPFFGAAFSVANKADTMLVKALKEAWVARGFTGKAPGLEGDFGRIEEERKPGDLPEKKAEEREGESDLDRQRRTHFLDIREQGQRALALGHGEVALPVKALGEAADALWNVQTNKPVTGRALQGLVSLLRQAAPSAQILAEVAKVKQWMLTQGDDEVRRVVGETLDRVERIVRTSLTSACAPDESEAAHNTHAGMCQPGESTERHNQHADVCQPGESEAQHAAHVAAVCQGETLAEHKAHEHPAETPAHYQEQIDRVNKFRGAGAVIITGPPVSDEWLAARERAAEEERDPAKKLEKQIERIFGHPYDTTWWHETLAEWGNTHKAVLSRYILERNSGQVESHAH